MIPVLTAEEMRAADRYTIEKAGVSGALLMERAGAAVARIVLEKFSGARRLAVLCGRGNNGGDGFVAARHLLGKRPAVCLVGAKEDVKGDALGHLLAFESDGGEVAELRTIEEWRAW